MPSITMDLINHSLDLMMQKYNYFLNTKIFFTLNFELRLLADRSLSLSKRRALPSTGSGTAELRTKKSQKL